MDIKVVTVIGASGNMGNKVSAIFASFANAKVYMIVRNKSEKYIENAIKSIRCESIKRNLFLADFSEIEKCVKESDLVFESVTENMAIKLEINDKVSRFLNKNAIYVTGTSGLSITEMASKLPDSIKSKYFGMHLFNPPYSMTLCELIKTKYVSDDLIYETKNYLEKVLHRTNVIVEDKPAFLANRIGFHFINLALQYAEKYKGQGGIDYIDSILGTFTGRAMAPCSTADFVGLDVHKAIVDNLYNNTNDYAHECFKLPKFIEELVSNNRLGKKCGCGLFQSITLDDKKVYLVYDIASGEYRKIRKYSFPFAEGMKKCLNNGEYDLAFDILKMDKSIEASICLTFLQEYIKYSKYVVAEVSNEILYCDDAMAAGFNWCPPLALENALFGANNITRYDFRSFFKAGK